MSIGRAALTTLIARYGRAVHVFILWVGFLGAWFLVAGPIHQAAGELREQELDREALTAAGRGVGEPEPVSRWWWLVPPVKYLREHRNNKAYREAVFHALDPGDREDIVDYMNKATGWLLVAVGGLCIAAKETWELLEHYELSAWVWLVVVVVMFLLSAGYAASTLGRADQMKGRSPRRAAR